VLAQLEGFDAPAAAWEDDLLPLRVADYEPAWLDAQCAAGRVVWTRRVPSGTATVVRATPVALVSRRDAPVWTGGAGEATAGTEPSLSAEARAVEAHLTGNGAAFFDEIVTGTRLLRTQVEVALAELVACGRVSSDSFAGLRALLVPSADRRPLRAGASVRRRRLVAARIEDAGRWARVQRGGAWDESGLDTVARGLLVRWGVVFRRLVDLESALPPWRDLLRVFHRLEARGEIRGGRFVAGFSGEQFALPDAVGALRTVRRTPPDGTLVAVSAADPLNVGGVLTPDARVAALAGNRILYRDGTPIAVREAGSVRMLVALEPAAEWQARQALVRRPGARTARALPRATRARIA
jgi:ATP-dependent Lhr-like helicase